MLINDNSSLKKMNGIYFDVGDKDYLGFKNGADEFHNKLIGLGIKHEYIIFNGGHADNGVERAISALTFCQIYCLMRVLHLRSMDMTNWLLLGER